MTPLVQDCLKLGFGMMRLPRLEDKSIDVEQTKQMVDEFIAAGGKYFDTAFVYDGSEQATRAALCDRYPREDYYLANKLNASEFASADAEAAKQQIQISLERTNAKYFDFYLLHGIASVNRQRYDDFGIWQYVKQLKEEGLIKHYGFSFHDSPEILDELLTQHPDAEFVQLQLNYSDWKHANIQAEKCYQVAQKHNVPVVVMEPVKGGLFANLPENVKQIFQEANPEASAASWAIRFAASLDGVQTVLSGMSSLEQMRDNLSFMKHFVPLSEEEQQVVERARVALNQVDQIPCTACHYCTGGCPMQIHIPEFLP